ncbi:Putative 115 kDa protein in type-1 retrotransposable element R1DM [Eumeta japonica]|uniref:115 kDa protein in type-1 retrotransposable element R1DM n=1 Tax=Eumeta variegata TaxID=151549 RepID=A0A4C2ACT7_EUMVA|nr:Putative 115 kDa protein in type-1 retrotransposable element R1DM [Eumeta japonica]
MESLWDGIYRVIRETGKPGGCPIKTDSGQVIGPDESATSWRKPFSLMTVSILTIRIIRNIPPSKGPGIDGFTSDICQAAIFRDLGLFLAMANKCLELGYFPRAWKVAAIKVIPKPGKEDYARPKSYRPIGLLPVLGKTVERMLVGASSGT